VKSHSRSSATDGLHRVCKETKTLSKAATRQGPLRDDHVGNRVSSPGSGHQAMYGLQRKGRATDKIGRGVCGRRLSAEGANTAGHRPIANGHGEEEKRPGKLVFPWASRIRCGEPSASLHPTKRAQGHTARCSSTTRVRRVAFRRVGFRGNGRRARAHEKKKPRYDASASRLSPVSYTNTISPASR